VYRRYNGFMFFLIALRGSGLGAMISAIGPDVTATTVAADNATSFAGGRGVASAANASMRNIQVQHKTKAQNKIG